MSRGRYGDWGKHIELFELWEASNEEPTAFMAMVEALGDEHLLPLAEGTGAPEGRADFPFFLQTVIRYRMRERFRNVAARWRDMVGIESAQDFRAHETSELGSIVGIEPIRENDGYPRMRSREAPGPQYSVAKHGGIYSVTFELIVNDETDKILNRIPREIGATSANYKSSAVISFLESNPLYSVDNAAMFSAGRNNEFTGLAADPTEDNVIAAVESMTLRRDVDNLPINIQPKKILTRTIRQKLRLQQVLRSAQTVERTAAVVGNTTFARGSDNPLSYDGGIMPPDSIGQEPWLNDADDWYIIGEADGRDALIMAFLRGRQEPFIGLKDPGVRDAQGAGSDPYSFETDGVDFKVRDIFGTAVGEPLLMIRMRPT